MKHTLKRIALMLWIIAMGAYAGSLHAAGTKPSADPVMTTLLDGTRFVVITPTENKTVPATVLTDYFATTFVPKTITVGGHVLSGNVTLAIGDITSLQAALDGKVASTITVAGHALSGDITLGIGDITSLQAALDGKALLSGTLAQFGTTTSAQLAGVLSDENGTGKALFAAGTMAIASGKTFTASNTLTVTGTDGSTLDIGGGGTLRTVALSGLYSDLSGRPSLGTAAALNVAASGDAAAGDVVKGNDTRLAAVGDVIGPASSTDNAVAVYDGATGKTLKNSSVFLGSAGEITSSNKFVLKWDTINQDRVSLFGFGTTSRAMLTANLDAANVYVSNIVNLGNAQLVSTAAYSTIAGLQLNSASSVNFSPSALDVVSDLYLVRHASKVLGIADSKISPTQELRVDVSGGNVLLTSLAGTVKVNGNATLYPNESHPAAYTLSCASGANDLYTVPTGRKALVSDIMVTNVSGGAVVYTPRIKISGTYYDLGTSTTESDGGLGHNYGMYGTKATAPVVLNAGETFSVGTNAAGAALWLTVVEFDDTSPLGRASLTTFVSGANTLFTVPTGKTVSFGGLQLSAANQPQLGMNAVVYRNTSGSTVTMGSINLVPSGGSPATGNQLAGSNSITSGSGFSKYFAGNLSPGDFISINVNSASAGQFVWVNYILF